MRNTEVRKRELLQDSLFKIRKVGESEKQCKKKVRKGQLRKPEQVSFIMDRPPVQPFGPFR